MMTVDANKLLKRLEPAVRPGSVGRPDAPRPAFEHQSFDQLLQLSSTGVRQTGRIVTAAFDAESELTEPEIRRLSAAADVAEHAGSKVALLLMDGRGFVLDVVARQLTDEMTANDTPPVVKLDAAVYVSPEEAESSRPPPMPGSGVVPAAMAQHFNRKAS